MEERIYSILMEQDEITWQTLILELIKNEEMDPWDVNISKLSERYIATLKKLQEMNLRLSGKVLLAAALLLRIKSSKLVGEDLLEFDRLLATQDTTDALYENTADSSEMNAFEDEIRAQQFLPLLPRTPQPRKRKVSIYDLIDALAQALNVKHRRILQFSKGTTLTAPQKAYDISELMESLYQSVMNRLQIGSSDRVSFSDLLPSQTKRDLVLTFIPLLHLMNARKIDLVQNEAFGHIWVTLPVSLSDVEKTE